MDTGACRPATRVPYLAHIPYRERRARDALSRGRRVSARHDRGVPAHAMPGLRRQTSARVPVPAVRHQVPGPVGDQVTQMTLAQTLYSNMVYDLRLVQRYREYLPEALARELAAFLAYAEEQDHARWAGSGVNYLRVAAMIERRILAAERRKDEPLPVAKLAAEYSVSDGTARRALGKLWARELLGKRKGRFVCAFEAGEVTL